MRRSPHGQFRQRRVRFETGEVADQAGPADAVDARVVHFQQHRQPSVRQALDHVALPQRMRPVEPLPGDVRAHLGELAVVARRGQADPVHMVVEVEILVLDPHRMVQVPEWIVEFAAERRDQRDAFGEAALELRERVAAGHGRAVEGEQAADVQDLRGRLQVEEARVQPAQSLHVCQGKAEPWPGRSAEVASGR